MKSKKCRGFPFLLLCHYKASYDPVTTTTAETSTWIIWNNTYSFPLLCVFTGWLQNEEGLPSDSCPGLWTCGLGVSRLQLQPSHELALIRTAFSVDWRLAAPTDRSNFYPAIRLKISLDRSGRHPDERVGENLDTNPHLVKMLWEQYGWLTYSNAI